MHIEIIALGKIKEKYLQLGTAEYLKRLKAYARTNIIEVPDEKLPPVPTGGEIERIQEKEGRRVLEKVKENSFLIVLDRQGQMIDSPGLAAKLNNLVLEGRSTVTLVIGGTLGLPAFLRDRADFCLSFSKMTFPHQLMRLILFEQLYRAFKIMRGEPYHK